MTLSTRTLMAMFAIANVSLIWLLAFSALQGVDAIDAEVQHSTSATSALHLSMDADMMHEGIQAQVYRAVLHGREGRQADLADARQSLAQAVTRLERDLAGVRQLGLSDEVQRRAAEAEPVARAYSEEARALVQLAGADAVQAQARLVSFEQRFEALERSLDELGDLIGAQAEGARQRGDEAVSSVRQRVLLMSGALTLVLISGLSLFGRFLWRTLGGEPMEAVKIAQAIAEGDLSAAPSTSPSLRHSVLGEMAQMSQQLRQLVDEVRSQAEEVSSASSQIAQGNLDLSERTEAQASSLQQTSASMQDLGGTLHQTTTDARQATQVAHHACDVAHRGGEVMAGVVQTMQGIRESASRIADIISVIDGIAFQTNILALNAAVEAARAGEEGKGFAVVASEVRSLAQRTSQAAREIKTLIGDSVTRVAVGAEQVESARSTMHDIVECIGQVSGLVEQITQASELQSSGLVDATQAVHTMDCATQQNATLVEETAAAAESLRSQAQRLVQVVSRFRLTPA